MGRFISVGTIRIRGSLWPLGCLHEEFGVFLLVRSDVNNGSEGLKNHGKFGGFTDAVERVTGVDAEVVQRYGVNFEVVAGALLVLLGFEGHHRVVAPPRDRGPWPAHRVTVQNDWRIQRHRYWLRVLVFINNSGGIFVRLCIFTQVP